MKPKNNHPVTKAFVELLALIIVCLMLFQTVASLIALPGCQDNCGDTPIPYPFGISPGCSLRGFELSCIDDTNILLKNDIQVLNIYPELGQLRVSNGLSYLCYNQDDISRIKTNPVNMALQGTPYRLNTRRNKFTVVGCNNLAYISFDDGTNLYLGGFIKDCNTTEIVLINGSCSGVGCWQTAIPTSERDNYRVDFVTDYNHSEDSSRCGYAVLMEDAAPFSSENVTADTLYLQQTPLILDWAIRNETCEVARANISTYACRSNYSVCVDSTNGLGYLCHCSDGYKGNPYLEGGCQGSLSYLKRSSQTLFFSLFFSF
jgi:Wall-associated receptor kinase galacturonan-binding